jgi:predicted Ser/Thr protein kinase
MATYDEIQEAKELLLKGGYVIGHPLSPAAKPYIRELSDVLEAAGYRLDEARIERKENSEGTGRILLALYPISELEMRAKKGVI